MSITIYARGLVEPGFATFQVLPHPASLEQASASVQTLKGEIKTAFVNKNGKFELTVNVPSGSQAIIGIPDNKAIAINLNGKPIWKNGAFRSGAAKIKYVGSADGFIKFSVPDGTYNFSASSKKQ